MGILHEYNVEVPESLQQLLENGIIDYHRCLLSQASVVGVPGGLRFKRSQRLADLRSLVREIDDFLSPLVKMDLIPFLVHFAAWKSSLFSISVHSSLSKTNRCVYVRKFLFFVSQARLVASSIMPLLCKHLSSGSVL